MIEADRLIDRYLDGELDAAAFAKLQSWINTAAENARHFMRRATIHDNLRDAFASADTAPAAIPFAASSRRVYRFAAALLLATAVVAIYLGFSASDPPSETREPQSTLASILHISDAATLIIDDQIAAPGERYTGRSVSLDSGEAEFMLKNAVSVRLRGETALTIHDPMNVTMAHGSAEFDCPPGAKGYTVHLPGGAKVVDLGTRFTVSIGPDADPSVRVTEGAVEVRRPGEPRPTRLIAGRAALLLPDRTVIAAAPSIVEHRPIRRPEDVANDGRLIEAVNLLDRPEKPRWGASLPVTVNGIAFTNRSDSIGDDWQASHHRVGSANNASTAERLADPLGELLTSIAFTAAPSASISLVGLDPGQSYRLQLIHYERPGGSRPMRITIGDRDPIEYPVSNPTADPAGDAMVYTWTADRDRLIVRYESADASPAHAPILSAVVLHEVDATVSDPASSTVEPSHESHGDPVSPQRLQPADPR